MTILLVILLAAPPVVAVMAALRDLTTMTIPNWMSLALAALFLPGALAVGLGWQDILVHLGVGVAALVIGVGLFALRALGGGDAKLLAALSLWMGLNGAAAFILWTAVIGGLFSLILILVRAHFAAVTPAGPVWVGRLLEPKGDIPYGVAIAAGALLAWPHTTMMATAF